MPSSSNKSVGSGSSNPKKSKKDKKKRDKDKGKKESSKYKDATDQPHHKKHKEPKEPKTRRSSTGTSSSSSKRHRRRALPRAYGLVLIVVAFMLCGVGVYYKRAFRSSDATTRTATTNQEFQQKPALPKRSKPIKLRSIFRNIMYTFERVLTNVVESPLFFPEARTTRLRRRALQEMRLNDEPLQDDPPKFTPPGYGPPPRLRARGRRLQAHREEQREALRAVQPVMLNGREQDCVSPRCLKDGSFPFFRWLENEQRRLVSPLSLCVFILDWGKGELEIDEEEEEEAEPWLGAASTNRRPGAVFLSGAGVGSEL